MKKLTAVMYNKLLLQAEEAKEQGMSKLANSILEAIGPYPAEEVEEYTFAELENDFHKGLWKLASQLMVYYGVQSADAEKVDAIVTAHADKMIDDLEDEFKLFGSVGVSEPSLPGEEK
jgi:hypothetical protein